MIDDTPLEKVDEMLKGGCLPTTLRKIHMYMLDSHLN